MYNLLICSSNLSFIKSIFNTIPYSCNKFRIVNIARSFKETKKMIGSGFIDGIIVDNYKCSIDIKYIQKIIYDSNLFPLPSIIIYSKIEKNKIENNNLIKIIQICPEKNEKLDIEILTKLQTENKKSLENMEDNARRELKKIGFKLSHRGTNYIIRTVILLKLSNNEEFFYNLEKNIYSIISLENKTSIENIKSNILKAINCAYKNNRKNKPRPKDLLFELLRKI